MKHKIGNQIIKSLPYAFCMLVVFTSTVHGQTMSHNPDGMAELEASIEVLTRLITGICGVWFMYSFILNIAQAQITMMTGNPHAFADALQSLLVSILFIGLTFAAPELGKFVKATLFNAQVASTEAVINMWLRLAEMFALIIVICVVIASIVFIAIQALKAQLALTFGAPGGVSASMYKGGAALAGIVIVLCSIGIGNWIWEMAAKI